jgi:uncharacterized protein YbbK (DUF523 family)
VSRCILGERVRYDGEIKHYPELNQWLEQHCHTLAVCPEVEMGLSVPRPPLHLVQTASGIQMRGRDDPELDVSAAMQQFCQQRPPQLGAIHGYIFKSRSPSCGIADIPLFNQQGEVIDHGRGLFVSAMLQHYPALPISDEQQLDNHAAFMDFLQQVRDYRQQL